MIEWSWITVVLCALGFALHFLSRWAEFWKAVGKIGAWEYIKFDPPGWAAAVVGTIAAYLVLPEAPALFGAAVSMTPLGAFTAGYMGSSIGAKLPALFGRTAGVR